MEEKLTLLEMFKNGAESWQITSVFIVALTVLSGLFVFFIAVVNYKKLADGQVGPAKPIFLTFIGAAMVAAGGFMPIIAETMLENGTYSPESLLSSVPQSGGMFAGVAAGLTSTLYFVQMIGAIAIMRGFLMFKAAAEGQQGQLGKAFTHVIGGVLAVNIQLTIAMLANTFAPGANLTWLGF